MSTPQRILSRRGFDQGIFPVNIAASRQMGVQIDETRQQRRVTEIDQTRTRGDGQG